MADPTSQGSQGTLFHSPTTGFGGTVFGSQTMLDVLGSGAQMSGLGPYMVAALLNARAGRTPVLTEVAVRNIWNDLINGGFFEPTAGIRWGASEIVAYLRTTMG